MNKEWVLNASPIISLGRADLLKKVSPLAGTWIVPEAVISEVEAKRTVEPYLSDLSSASNVTRESVEKIHSSVAAWDLGRGESEALTIALRRPGSGVVLDDLQARKCAVLLNVPLMGSLGLIVLAKRKGLLDLARPSIERLIDVGFHINAEIVETILRTIGEGHAGS